MSTPKSAAIAATVLLSALIVFQVLLAAGVPLGSFAWGGRYSGVLPDDLRRASLIAVPILLLAAWSVLARSRLLAAGSGSRFVRVAVWVFAGYFTLNMVMNLMSDSMAEKLTMTPVAALLAAGFFVVARS